MGEARDELVALVKTQPNNADVYDSLARAYCGLDKRNAAMSNAERAVDLLSVAKEALIGPIMKLHVRGLTPVSEIGIARSQPSRTG